jgi:exo beta-1,2-glucooligosaccharide sophorohydrolase (non-reducing end)
MAKGVGGRVSVHRTGWRCAGMGMALVLATPGLAQSYDEHVVFDNARASGPYHFSKGRLVAPSTFELDHDAVPVDTHIAHSPPNSLRLKWTSRSGGDWQATLDIQKYFRTGFFVGDTISFWAYADDAIEPAASPGLVLSDADGHNTATARLLGEKRLPARQWVQIRLTPDAFVDIVGSTTDRPFDMTRLAGISIGQALDDGKPHTLYIDDIRIENSAIKANYALPTTPQGVTARGYDRHIDIAWQPAERGTVDSWRIERSVDGQPFAPIGTQKGHIARYEDFLGASGKTARYRVVALNGAGQESGASATVEATTRALSDDELLTMVQEAQFRSTRSRWVDRASVRWR